jgi:hypothetical protein
MFVRRGSDNIKVECFHIKADLKISSEQVNSAVKLKAEHRHLFTPKAGSENGKVKFCEAPSKAPALCAKQCATVAAFRRQNLQIQVVPHSKHTPSRL